MKRFLSYAAGHPMTFEVFCNFAHELGFAGVELIPDLSPNLPEELTKERRKTLKVLGSELGLTFTVHNIFYDINHTSLVPPVRQLAYELTRDVIEFSRDIGAVGLILHPGYQFSAWRSKPDQKEMFREVKVQVYPRLGNLSREYGVPILIENGNYYYSARHGVRNPMHIGIEAHDLVSIAELPTTSFGICFDIGKAYFSSNDCTVAELLDYLEVVSPHLQEVHLNAFNGYLDVVPPVLNWLKTNNFDVPIVFECRQADIEALLEITAFVSQ